MMLARLGPSMIDYEKNTCDIHVGLSIPLPTADESGGKDDKRACVPLTSLEPSNPTTMAQPDKPLNAMVTVTICEVAGANASTFRPPGDRHRNYDKRWDRSPTSKVTAEETDNHQNEEWCRC